MGSLLKETDFVLRVGERLEKGRWSVIAGTLFLLAATALADWSVGKEVSLGVLYVAPMMLGAFVLSTWEIAALALLSAFLRSRFDSPGTQIRALIALRICFTFLLHVRTVCRSAGAEPACCCRASGEDTTGTGAEAGSRGTTASAGCEQPRCYLDLGCRAAGCWARTRPPIISSQCRKVKSCGGD